MGLTRNTCETGENSMHKNNGKLRRKDLGVNEKKNKN
jgi:hypothetical protein